MAASDYAKDSTVRNAVYIQRYAKSEYKKAEKYLNNLLISVNGEIASGNFNASRSRDVILTIQRLNAEYMAEMQKQIADSAVNAGKYGAEFTKKLLEKETKIEFAVPDESIISTMVLTAVLDVKPGLKTITIHEAILSYGKTKGLEITRAINDGIMTGKTKDEIIDDVTSVVGIAKRQAETLVRTSINSASNIGRMATFVENEQFLDGYEWVSKLDDRTTDICTDLDGKVYQFGTGGPIPPAHWGCRSQIVAAIKQEYK